MASGNWQPAQAERPMPVTGKESVANSHSPIWPRNRKVPGPCCFYCGSRRPRPIRARRQRAASRRRTRGPGARPAGQNNRPRSSLPRPGAGRSGRKLKFRDTRPLRVYPGKGRTIPVAGGNGTVSEQKSRCGRTPQPSILPPIPRLGRGPLSRAGHRTCKSKAQPPSTILGAACRLCLLFYPVPS